MLPLTIQNAGTDECLIHPIVLYSNCIQSWGFDFEKKLFIIK